MEVDFLSLKHDHLKKKSNVLFWKYARIALIMGVLYAVTSIYLIIKIVTMSICTSEDTAHLLLKFTSIRTLNLRFFSSL